MTSKKVLLVDDDVNLLAAFRRQYRNRFEMSFATGGKEALKLLADEGPFAVVICDMNMPEMNGVETLHEIERQFPDTVRMMLTGNADQKTAVDAINSGHILRFFNKPCAVDLMTSGIEAGLEHYRLVMAERELLEKTLAGSVQVLVDVLSTVDPHAFGWSLWLRDSMTMISKTLGWQSNYWENEIAALLSQIGWVCIPTPIVEKNRRGIPLSPAEKEILDKVPEAGANLIARIPRLERVAEIILYQDKGYDGSGFPEDEVRRDDIPMASRILKILLDALKVVDVGQIYPERSDFNKLQEKSYLYDSELFSIICALFEKKAQQEDEAPEEIRELPASLLLPGQLLLSDIRFKDGGLILAKGYVLTESQIMKVKNLSTLREIDEPIRVKTRQTVQKTAII